MMTEGEELILKCQALCKPTVISFNWMFNDKRINLQSIGSLWINEINLKLTFNNLLSLFQMKLIIKVIHRLYVLPH